MRKFAVVLMLCVGSVTNFANTVNDAFLTCVHADVCLADSEYFEWTLGKIIASLSAAI